jgi:CheY-like chemotaxis protein
MAIEMMSRLKIHPLCKHIPLLAIVGPSWEINGEGTGRPVADQFLRSPVDIDEAKRALRLLFERVGASDATVPAAEPRTPSAAVANDGSACKEPDQQERPDEERKPRQRPLILVIDDDPDISAAIARRLSTYGVDVLPAFSGMPGFWKAVDIRPDVILCDMRMPDGEGNYIAGRLQSHPLTHGIPVIVITGHANPGSKRVMMSMGVAAYFSKPLIMKELLNELRRHIDLPHSPSGPMAVDAAPRLPSHV